MITRIHVNQPAIRANLKGEDRPVFSVIRQGKTIHCRSVTCLGPSKLVYSPEKPLSCGARVWIETTSEIEVE